MAKKEVKSGFNNDIIGIIIITLAILTVMSFFANESTGMAVIFLRKLFFSVFGIETYIVPIFMIFLGLCFIMKNGRFNANKKFYGIILFMLNTLLVVQMFSINTYYVDNNVMEGIKKIYDTDSSIHGGIIGYLIDIPIYKLFGFIGSFVIFIAIYAIAFILISQITLYDVIIKLKPNIKNKKTQSVNKMKQLEIIDEKALDILPEEEEKPSLIKNIGSKIKIIDFIKPSEEETEEIKVVDKEINKKHNHEDKEEANEKIKYELEQEIEKNSSEITMHQYEHPSPELLNQNNLSKLNKDDKRELISNASKLEETLNSFGVEAKVVQVTKGPSVTRFELQPNAGVKVSKILNLADDIALNLAASGVRIEAPIPGKSAVGIEVPNKELNSVFLREVIESPEFVNSTKNIAFCLGKDIAGNCVVADLTKMPHMLIAGATGSGKSVCINTLVVSLLYKYSPEDVKLLMVDPKVVELNVYNGIPHLLIPVVTDPKKAAGALNWAVNEMTKRYKTFAENNVKNIDGYNELVSKGMFKDKMPRIVIVVDELADLMMVSAKDVEDYIGRLAQMARAAGMYLVIATQRPSVDVITGVIKSNIPSRISFAVSSQIDSRTILDQVGAEKLLGKGDMLFSPAGESKPIRIQGAFVSEDEVERVVEFVKMQKNEPDYKTEILEELDAPSNSGSEEDGDTDELINEAIRIVVEAGQASTSLIQRRLRIGYNRAARIIEQLEEQGIISSRDGSKPRQILIEKDEIEN